MTNLKAQIEISADASGVEAGVSSAKKSLSSLGGAAEQAGKAGRDGLGSIGNTSDAAAKKIESATRNTISSLQRQIAAFEAGGTSSRQYQESLARLRGVDVSALKPYLDQLDAAKKKAGEASASVDIFRLSAAGVGSALAGLVSGIGVGGLAVLVKGLNDGVDALNDIKDATGATIENISALEDVAARTGTSFDTVGASLIKFNSVLKDAKPGSDAEQALKAIGLSSEELKRIDPAEALRQTAVALSGFADDGNKARLTQELFGKSLKDVAPFLKDLADQGRLNATVTTEQAQAAEDYNKQLFALQKNLKDVGRGFTTDLVTGLNAAAEAYRANQNIFEAINAVFNGNDQNRNDRALVDQTEELLRLENDVLQLKSTGIALDAAAAKKKEERIKVLKEEINTTLAYRKVLNDTGPAVDKPSAPEIKPKGKPPVDLSADGVKIYNDAISKASGFSADYIEKLNKLYAAQTLYALSSEQVAEAVRAINAEQPFAIEAAKEQEELEKSRAKSLAEYTAEQVKQLAGYQNAAAAVEKSVQKYEDEEEALKIAAAQNITLAQAIAQVEIARLREAQAVQLSFGNQDAADAIQKEITARSKLATLINGKDTRDAATTAAKNAASDWQRASDQISASITDALFRGFESGKGFIENLRDTVVNTFKTMVLQPVVKATISTVGGAAAGSLGFSGAANAATGALGTTAALTTLGSVIGSTFSAGFGASLAGSTGAALSTGLTAIGTATGTGVAAGLGVIAGALAPYAIGATLLYGLMGGFKGEYVKSTGDSQRNYGADGSLTSAAQMSGVFRNSGDADKLVDSLQKQYATSAAALGIKTVASQFNYGSNNSDGGKFSLGGGAGGSSFYQGETKTTDEAVSLAAARAVYAALQGSELPKYLQGAFDGLAASSATKDQIDGALQYANTLKQLDASFKSLPLQQLQDASFATTKQLIDLSGGIEKLSGNLAGYYDNFFSDEEKRANTLRNVQNTLNAAGGSFSAESVSKLTREGFRALVEETDPNSPLFAALLSVQGAVADLNPKLTSAANNFKSLGDSITDEIKRIRGQVDGTGKLGFARAQAEFAVTTAKARAGDQAAAKELPALSKTLEELAKANSTTLVDLNRIRGLTANSLQETASILSSLGVTPTSGASANSMLYTVPASKAASPNAGVETELQTLRAENEMLRAEVRANVTQTAKLVKLFERIVPAGDALQTRAIA